MVFALSVRLALPKEKKMPKSELTRIAKFYPAVLTTQGDKRVIQFSVFDPQTEKMVRKRIRLGRTLKPYRTKAEQNRVAQRMCEEVNAKLRGGWSPLHEADTSRLYTPLPVLRDKFLDAKRAEGCRDTTLVQYTSVCNLFLRWVEDYGFSTCFSGTFLRPQAVQYMDYCMELGNRHRSYNNTIKVLKVLFAWAVEHCYAKENPFANIKQLKKEQKIRILVDGESRKKIDDYYKKVCPAMRIVIRLVYNSAIRPAEILRLKVGDVNLAEHFIYVSAENAKNHHERFASLTPELVEMLAEHIGSADERLYIFGNAAFVRPAKVVANPQFFQKSWARMREKVGIPKEMQLYSLRDSGLTDLLHAGVDQLTVQHHADHSSLAMQDIYTHHRDEGVGKAIWEHGPKF